MSARTVPVRPVQSRGRAILLGSLGVILMLAAGVVLGERQAHPVTGAPIQRAVPAIRLPVNELARLREFARSVVGRAVLLQPGEGLPRHVLQREERDGDDEDHSPHAEAVSPEMLFEGAVRDAAREKQLSLEQARAALRDFAAQVRGGTAAEFLDAALASFAGQDYAGAERQALAAAAQCEPTTRGSGDAAAQLLQVIADPGNTLRDAGVRPRAALQLAGDAQMMQSKFWEAETSYRAAGRLVSKADTARWIESQWRVALANGARGHFNISLPLWQEIASVCDAKLGPHDRTTLRAQCWVAWETKHTSRDREAASLQKRVLSLQLKHLGTDDLDVACSLSALVRLDFQFESESEALAIRQSELGLEHPETLRNLRRIRERYRSYSERTARKALAVSERIFGPEHLEVAADAEALAERLEAEGSASEIESLYRRVIAIREKRLGWDDPSVPLIWKRVDRALAAQGKKPEYERLLRRRLSEAEKKVGPQHIEVVRRLAALTSYLRETRSDTGQQELELYRKTLSICDALLGDAPEDVPNVEDRIVLLEKQRGALGQLHSCIEPEVAAAEHLAYRFTEATARLLKARVERAERAAGAEHPDLAAYLEDEAAFVERWKKPADALPLWRRAFEIRLKAFGPEEASVILPLRQYYAGQETPEGLREAEAVARRMLALEEKRADAAPLELGQRLTELAALLHEQGERAELEPLLLRAVAAFRNPAPDSGELWLPGTYIRLAEVLRETGRASEAVPLYRQAIALNEAGDDSYRKLTAADQSIDLSALLGELGRFTEAEAQLDKAFKVLTVLTEGGGGWGDVKGPFKARATKGVLLAQQGRYREARTWLAEALDGMKKANQELDEVLKFSSRAEVFSALGGYRGYGRAEIRWTLTKPPVLPPYEKCLAETEAALAKGVPEGRAKRP